MTKRTVTWYQILLSTLAFIIITSLFVAATPTSNDSVTIVASVAPLRTVIVDNDLNIIKIYSNTMQNVRPQVYLGGLDGAEQPFSDSISRQYQSLKSSLDFSKPGLIYQRPLGAVGSILRSIAGVVKRLLGF